MLKTRILLAVATLAFAVSSVSAAIWQLDATLTGTSVVPSNPSPGTGSVSVILDDISGQVTLTGSFTDLIGNSTASHIHGPALPTVNGPVILPLTISPGVGVTSGTLSGNGVFTGQQVADLLAGLNYVTVHTTQYPGGEIRGQLTVVPEPATLGIAATGALFTLRRPRRR